MKVWMFQCAYLVAVSACLPEAQDSYVQQSIYGGQDTTIQQHPWQVSIVGVFANQGRHYCGGTIINQNWILTAQHCVDGNYFQGHDDLSLPMGGSDFGVVVGITSGSGPGTHLTDFPTSSIHQVDAVVRAPGYEPPGLRTEEHPSLAPDEDLALLHLATPLTYSSNVASIPLITPIEDEMGATADGVSATITGWGVLSDDTYPNTLQEAAVTINASSSSSEDIFAGGGGIDSCGADSGGPLAVQVMGRTYQAGIVSWGDGCGSGGFYRRVSPYSHWIGSVVTSVVTSETWEFLSGGTSLVQQGYLFVPSGTLAWWVDRCRTVGRG